MRATRREFLKMAAGSAAALSAAAGGGVRAEENRVRKPNILFLMTDQHRFDCLGCNGNSIIKTPNFDRIAREGVRFTNAYSSMPTCTPARTQLLTGFTSWHHGMLAMVAMAPHYPVEMPRQMHDAGYYTYAIGKLHYHPQRNYHGFDGVVLDESGRAETPEFVSDYRKWFAEQAPGLDPDETGIGWNDCTAAQYALSEELHPTYWTGRTAVEYIKNYNKPEPLFLKVSFARPHSPYDPPKRFWEMYKDQDMPDRYEGDWDSKYIPRSNPEPTLWHGKLPVEEVRHARRGYYGSVSFIDEQIGHILKALEDKGMLEDTLILFTSDHGDMLGDHYLWRKSYAYESSAHISMLMRIPESMSIPSTRGKTIDQTVELRDVLPTFLDAAGAKIPGEVDGDSILELVRGNSLDWRPYLDLEHGCCYSEQNNWNAFVDGRGKYIYHAYFGTEQLFDLKNDPGELRDLASDPAQAGRLKEWRRRMVEHLSERGEAFVRDGSLAKRSGRMMTGPNFPKYDS